MGLITQRALLANVKLPEIMCLWDFRVSAYVVLSAPSFLEKSACRQSAWVHTPAPSRCVTLDMFLNPLCFSSLDSNVEITSLLRLLQGFDKHLHWQVWALAPSPLRGHPWPPPMLDCTHLPCSSLCLVATLCGDCLLTFPFSSYALCSKKSGVMPKTDLSLYPHSLHSVQLMAGDPNMRVIGSINSGIRSLVSPVVVASLLHFPGSHQK